jgi:dipeptidyl aminopeptidase/acylaminoacyl peptidase
MDRNKKPYEWLVFKGEGHGFLKTENRTEMYERIEKFLDKHMPSGR